MRKAFDANVSRTKPKLRLGGFSSTAVLDEAAETVAEAPASASEDAGLGATDHKAQVAADQFSAAYAPEPARQAMTAPVATMAQAIVDSAPAATHHEVPAVSRREAAATPVPVARVAVKEKLAARLEATKDEPVLDPQARRERLKERLRAATNKVTPAQPTPQNPTEARASALSLVGQLKQEVEDARGLNAALAKDLDQARADLSRAASEARSRTDEANRMAGEVAERVRLLEELSREMASVEAERDDALVELRSSRAEIEKGIAEGNQIAAALAAREAELADALTEEERIATELERRNEDLRRSEVALLALTTERDALAKQVTELTEERVRLLESQRALDEIHRALADARVRAGARP
jgi:chromosome segregation ATPase